MEGWFYFKRLNVCGRFARSTLRPWSAKEKINVGGLDELNGRGRVQLGKKKGVDLAPLPAGNRKILEKAHQASLANLPSLAICRTDALPASKEQFLPLLPLLGSP